MMNVREFVAGVNIASIGRKVCACECVRRPDMSKAPVFQVHTRQNNTKLIGSCFIVREKHDVLHKHKVSVGTLCDI